MSPLGKEIFRTYDEFGPVQVFDDGNRRYLSFGDDREQSCLLTVEPQRLQHDYARAMLLALLFVEPRDAILFGLGGGAMPSCLYHHFPELTLRVVELRPAVIKIAYRYFQLPRDPRLRVLTMDAGEFLEEPDQAPADLLFSDIYRAEGLDVQQLQPWFIERCAGLLRPAGWLVLNLWQDHRGEREILEVIGAHFADVRVCGTADGNWIVLAGKRADTADGAELRQRARALSRRLGCSFSDNLKRLAVYPASA
jgi:spermidine synthase